MFPPIASINTSETNSLEEQLMTEHKHPIATVLLGAAIMVLAAAAGAQSTSPGPPKQVCVNNVCVNSAVGPTSATSTGSIKWHPGHYVLSAGITTPTNGGWPGRKTELDAAGNNAKVLGWRGIYTWAALEPSKGNYDFSAIDRDLQYLATQYSTPKRMALLVLPGTFFGGSDPNSYTGYIPSYVLSDSSYGAGMNGSSHGYWGSSSSYMAAVYRPAVMGRYIALIQALGARYNSNPYFEAIILPETAGYIATLTGAPDWSDNALLAQLKSLVTASVAAFPNTNVAMQNNYMQGFGNTAALTAFLAANRASLSGPDIFGASAVQTYGAGKGYTWGQQALMGLNAVDSSVKVSDLRGTMPVIHDVQMPELDGSQFGNIGAPYSPQDIFNNANGNLRATHVFWNYVYSGPGNWQSVLAMINSNPITNTACPSNYGGKCATN
jgi:hypothetical protein